jgi:muramidase (phage lysozyme)
MSERHPNLTAFLDMIAHAEGTDRIGDQNGYNVLVGGGVFNSYEDHPNLRVRVRDDLWSTAAGRYQILYRFWVHYRKKLRLPDFSPESQDAYAIAIICERRAYDDILAGRIAVAINKCRNIWASLPGAGYGQRELTAETLIAFYVQKGGQNVA